MLIMSCFRVSDDPTHPSTPVCVESPSPDPNSSLRIKLSDGRYLAYRETGVPKKESIYRVIIVHGFGSSKEMRFPAPQELMDDLRIYIVLFDRAGYGESDPNVKRSMKSEASDIEELADQLELGSRFYVIGVSVGSYPTWSCLKSIPQRQKQFSLLALVWFEYLHFPGILSWEINTESFIFMSRERISQSKFIFFELKGYSFFVQKLAGVALIVPFINYKWPSLPNDLIKDDYRKNLSRWTYWIARYAPGLVHWWLTQKMFHSSSVLDRNPTFFSNKDLEVLKNTPGYQLLSKNKLKDRSVFDSHRGDFIVAFGKWDFDPLDLNNPFPQNKSPVHIWQGYEDKVVPFQLQRYVSKKLPWIQYHEVPDGGHLLVYDSVVCEAILRSLLLGEDPPFYRPNLAI